MSLLILSHDERKALEEELADAPNPYIDPKTAQLFAHQRVVAACPLRLLEALYRMRSDATACGWLLVKNCPMHFIPPTPADGDGRSTHKKFGVHAFLMGLMQELGHILTNRGEKKGQVPADIIPISKMARSISNAGYTEPLGMHTENVHLPEHQRPTYVGLLTIRGDPAGQAVTMVAEARDIVAQLDDETIHDLRQPEFVVKMSESFKSGPAQSKPMPVLSGPEDMVSIATEFNATLCLTPRAKKAFGKLMAVVEQCAITIRLETGDLLVTCNRRTIHGRGRFNPDFSNNNVRWLLRVCTVADAFAVRDVVAPGANRAFDLTTAHIRDMVAHCTGVLGVPQIIQSDISIASVRAAIKAYDDWLNVKGSTSMAAESPNMELIVFVAHSIVLGEMLSMLPREQRIATSLLLVQHAELELGLRGYDITIDLNRLTMAFNGDASVDRLLQICLGGPNHHESLPAIKGEAECLIS